MIIKQISIFIENRSGRASDIISRLESSGVAIDALCLADTASYGILRIIVRDHEESMKKIRKLNLAASENPLLCVKPTKSFTVSKILNKLADAGISVEYMYTLNSAGDSGSAELAICVDDEEAGERLLAEYGV